MPPPAMPTTMRGDGRGTKLQPKKAPGRYFAGKGVQESESSDSEAESEDQSKDTTEQEDSARAVPKVQLKEVDLTRHFEAERIAEAQRRALEAEEEGDDSANEYETEGSESEEEEESEDEGPRRVMLKPVFVPKNQRQNTKGTTDTAFSTETTSTTRPDPAEVDTSLDEQQKRRLQARKLIEEEIRREATQKVLANEEEDGNDVDDTDDLDPEAEKSAWKLRELLRIKRDRDQLESREREREELELRRAMPEEARLAEDLARVQREKEEKMLERANARDLQGSNNAGKYHHKGGFYLDDPVLKRSLEGSIENTQSGAGLRGATRWKGLADQDTSRDSLRYAPPHDTGSKRSIDKIGDHSRDQFDTTRKRRN